MWTQIIFVEQFSVHLTSYCVYTCLELLDDVHLCVCLGTAVFLEVGGTDCTKLCVQAVSGDNAYVSPTPEQGQKDVDAFNSYLDINVGM